MIKTLCLTLISFSLFFGLSAQTTHYVSTSGSNSNNGSSGSPWLTIQYAVDHSTSNDIIIVGAGTYNEYLTINKPLTLKGDPLGSQPTIQFTDAATGGITITANNVTVRNFRLYRPGNNADAPLLSIPKGGVWPNYTIDYSDIIIKNCTFEWGRYALYVHVQNLTVDSCSFLNNYRNGIILGGVKGTTNILHNNIDGTVRNARNLVYITTGSGLPDIEGTININYNTSYKKVQFFIIDFWGVDLSKKIDLNIKHNSIDYATSKPITFYWPPVNGFTKFSSIVIQDNIMTNGKLGVVIDFNVADNNRLPANGQIVVNNCLFYNNADDANYTKLSSNSNIAWLTNGPTPPGASDNMYSLSGNLSGNPLYIDPTHANQNFQLNCGSPAINAASDGMNIGANQVVPSGPTVFTGTGNWEDAVRWSNGIPATCKDVTIHGVCSITSASALCNTLTIDSSAQLTLNTGNTLTISSTFLIRSTGSYLDKGTTVVNTANITVQRYMTGNWTGGVPTTSTIFHYLSSPVSSATSGMFSGDQLYQYNELTHLWDLITSSIVMTPGTGYAAALSANKVKSFTGGSLNSSDITITGLTLTGGVTDYSGYHLIGNPYPCSLLWDNTWAKTNLDATACIWDHTNGHYWYQNGITGNGPFANGIIPAEQAFYIKANANGGSITIPQAKRLHSTQTFYKKEEPVTLSLKLSGDDGYDETVIMFTPGSTLEFDHPFDCQKLWGNDAATEIFSWIDGTVPASINVLPDETNCPAIPVGIKVRNTGSYSIDVTGLETFNTNITIFLEDKLTGAMQNLRTNPDYTFSSGPQTPSDPNRFLVHFGPTGIGVMSGPSIRIFAIEKNVYVNISEETQGTISIYNLLGEKIAEKDIAGNTKNIISLDVTEGIYIVKIFGNDIRFSSKIFIY